MKLDLDFYKGKKVLVTGHTGFKGSWLSCILANVGAKVIGYSLEAPTNPNLFTLSGVEKDIVSIIGDIRDFDHLKETFEKYKPEIVFHLAAQPIVRESYKDPLYTYQTNVIGTANVMEAVRTSNFVKSVVNITTDKVYLNNEDPTHAFKEDEKLDGFDPYSNSKSCSELVTHSYKRSFFDSIKLPVSTARAGNVIGGGDFSKDRIIPDAVRAICNKQTMIIRNPNSIRPYQHVLEPLFVYLTIAERQFNDFNCAGYYNVGPDENDCVTTGELIKKFSEYWDGKLSYEVKSDGGPHEAGYLKLDCSKLKKTFNWKPTLAIDDALCLTAEWTKVYINNPMKVREEMDREIDEFIKWIK
jgi:CDP-glucose 4,6-dehydratase